MKWSVHYSTCYNIVSAKEDCYIWHEGTRTATVNEFLSIVPDNIIKNVTPERKIIMI